MIASFSFPDLPQIYLHVISYNIPARRFYEKNGFLHVKHNPGPSPSAPPLKPGRLSFADFYSIKARDYSSETFVRYLQSAQPPLEFRLYRFFRSVSPWPSLHTAHTCPLSPPLSLLQCPLTLLPRDAAVGRRKPLWVGCVGMAH
jgi:hypothetical protein